MIYEIASIVALAQQCAPEIATEALVPLVVTESTGDPLRININHGPRVTVGSAAEGAALARRYIAAGYTVDIGLAQINSRNITRFGVSLEEAFDPCTNLRMASSVLQANYDTASRSYSGLAAISATYSLYNTGSMTRGLSNGYVEKVWRNAATGVPTPASSVPANIADAAPEPSAPQRPPAASWVVGQVQTGVEVFK